jgi:hypothetical protein
MNLFRYNNVYMDVIFLELLVTKSFLFENNIIEIFCDYDIHVKNDH